MAGKKLMPQDKIVKKSNALARAKWYPDSVWEPRLVALLASKIRPHDTDFQKYEIRLVDLLGKEPGGKDYKELETAVDKAISRIITLRNDNGWKKYTLFSSCELDRKKGVLIVEFHPDLREHYLQLKQYMQYNLIEFMLLPSVYSQRMFEILKSWDDQPEVTISLSDLHQMLDVPRTLREKYKDFRVRVLEKAHRDILRFTDLEYDWEPVKIGRAMSEIRFTFSRKAKRKAAASKKTDKILQSASGAGMSDAESANRQFEEFLARFPEANRSRIKAGRLWHELHRQGCAPLAKNVNGHDDPVEFLKQWQASRKDAGPGA